VKYNVDIQSNLCFDELIEVNVHEQELLGLYLFFIVITKIKHCLQNRAL